MPRRFLRCIMELDCGKPADRDASVPEGLDILCRMFDEGLVCERATELPRAWPLGLDEELEADVAGRGCGFAALRERRGFGRPEFEGIRVLIDLSDTGGDGGVGMSEMPDEEAVLVGGVSKVGDEALVVVGDSSDRGEPERATGRRVKVFFLMALASTSLRNFSLVMSVSTRRSESSSLTRCASIRKASRSCSPERTSSSSMTPLSMA